MKPIVKSLTYIIFFACLLIPILFALNIVPYLPGDITLTRYIQLHMPNSYNWAQIISDLADFPGFVIPLGVTFAATFAFTYDMSIAFFSLFNFAAMMLLTLVLKLAIFQPRPSADLIMVSGYFSGSAFPSASALVFAATFGFLCLLSWHEKPRSPFLSFVVGLLSSLMLIAIFFARIFVGAHWPSDMIISFLISFIWLKYAISYINVCLK